MDKKTRHHRTPIWQFLTISVLASSTLTGCQSSNTTHTQEWAAVAEPQSWTTNSQQRTSVVVNALAIPVREAPTY